MKIYNSYSDESYKSLELQKEWVYIEEDSPLDYYKKEETDIDVRQYLCKVNLGEYVRVSYKRRYFLGYKEVKSLEDLEKWMAECFKKQIWFEIGFKDGIMQFDPWHE